MKSQLTYSFERLRPARQRGLVLFFALIALLVLSLAAAALIRSVDTNAVIAGNLAFKQSATSSGDEGVEAAITWLTTTQTANNGLDVLTNTDHAFNQNAATSGYYSSVDNALDLFADATWNISTVPPITDNSGNTIRYIIQRLCRTPNVAVKDADCLFSGATEDENGQNIRLPQDVCSGAGCPVAGQAPELRITSRVDGPRNTISYVQAIVY